MAGRVQIFPVTDHVKLVLNDGNYRYAFLSPDDATLTAMELLAAVQEVKRLKEEPAPAPVEEPAPAEPAREPDVLDQLLGMG